MCSVSLSLCLSPFHAFEASAVLHRPTAIVHSATCSAIQHHLHKARLMSFWAQQIMACFQTWLCHGKRNLKSSGLIDAEIPKRSIGIGIGFILSIMGDWQQSFKRQQNMWMSPPGPCIDVWFHWFHGGMLGREGAISSTMIAVKVQALETHARVW